MVSTKFDLRYSSNIGFAADQGGRGFQHPSDLAIRPVSYTHLTLPPILLV